MKGIDELEPVFWEYEEEKIDVTKLFISEAWKVIIILKFGLYLDYSLSYALSLSINFKYANTSPAARTLLPNWQLLLPWLPLSVTPLSAVGPADFRPAHPPTAIPVRALSQILSHSQQKQAQ